ncbi:hypothetical protein [Bradyrhizobium sp. WSM471]|uniref:hypothetical protein n=1 Tax=Bradyrhizobium sp. WSM471 TaxID=319017 RepID=UPI00030E1BDA|nr:MULTISPECIES: hypothetical protein [Bradyrhizobium]UFW42306.1 hypothetical protein BcanWSM471_03600 [Bradyrhizobium canariense]
MIRSAERNKAMALGRGWHISPDGGKTELPATLVFFRDIGDRHLAVFKIRAS